jgi:hypothetical protein
MLQLTHRRRSPRRYPSQETSGIGSNPRFTGNQTRLRRLAAHSPRYGAVDDPTADVSPKTEVASGMATPAPIATGTSKVKAVTAITGKTNALTGFPSLPGVPDLNTPGAINNTTTGACQNVQQIKFDLAAIAPNEVDLLRLKDGAAGQVGKEKPRKGNDGPSDPGKLRGSDFIAVADTPGISLAPNATTIDPAAFPLRYSVDFQLFAFDIVSKAILAKVTYSVNILKQTQSDPAPVNEFKNWAATIF